MVSGGRVELAQQTVAFDVNAGNDPVEPIAVRAGDTPVSRI